MHKFVSNPDGRVSPSIRDDSIPAPACSPGTPMPSKRRNKALNLSPVTPKCNEDTCELKGKRPNVKVNGRFTRSMVTKVSVVKSAVSNNVDIEIVVLDDEEEKPVSPDYGLDIDHEPFVNPADSSPHVSDKNLQVDPVVDSPMKGKSVEVNLPGSYQIGEAVHPLFVSCLLDKIHRMEIELTEMVTRDDVIRAENLRLKEEAD